MTLRFHYNEQHALAQIRHFWSSSEEYASNKLRHHLSLPCFLIVFTLVHAIFNKDGGWDYFHITAYLAVLIPAILWLILHPVYWKRKVRKEAHKHITSSEWRRAYGEITIRMDEDHFHTSSSLGSSSVVWLLITDSQLTPDYLFITREGERTYPVPIAEVGQDTAQQAHAFIQAHIPKTTEKEDPENDSIY